MWQGDLTLVQILSLPLKCQVMAHAPPSTLQGKFGRVRRVGLLPRFSTDSIRTRTSPSPCSSWDSPEFASSAHMLAAPPILRGQSSAFIQRSPYLWPSTWPLALLNLL